jgi:DnaK suppressor protein
MSPEERQELKREIVDEIEAQKHLIKSLEITSRPVPPDDAIGRLTRMEAISSKGVSEASLHSARTKLVKLETALGKVDHPDFGICIRGENPIPLGRIKAMPENVLCVPWAEKR